MTARGARGHSAAPPPRALGLAEVVEEFPESRIVDLSGRYSRWAQTTIGLILTGAILLALLTLVGTSCVLALQGRVILLTPLLQALQPYVLPTLGAAVGYAFGIQVWGRAVPE